MSEEEKDEIDKGCKLLITIEAMKNAMIYTQTKAQLGQLMGQQGQPQQQIQGQQDQQTVTQGQFDQKKAQQGTPQQLNAPVQQGVAA